MENYNSKPLVYSCSGCSNVAQMCNSIALWLDKNAYAEMSCIAGIGGNVKAILHKAKNRPRIVLDGCPLHCAKSCMNERNFSYDLHIDLAELGLKKQYHEMFSEEECVLVIEEHVLPKVKMLLDLQEKV